MKKIFAFVTLLFLSFLLFAQDNSVYQKKYFIKNNDTLRYRIMYPLNYDAHKKYPLILFLHGAGERGNDNELQLIHGSRLFADPLNREKFPAIVLFPQCSSDDFWANIRREKSRVDSSKLVFDFPVDIPMGKSLALVSRLLDSLVSTGNINKKKIYVGGLSMGGMGTFEILWRKPGFFAAAIPICGGGNETKVKEYGKNFPIWVFHGDADPVVDVSHSRKMVATLKAVKAKVKYSEYPGVGHDSWTNAFAEPTLLQWLFDQKR
jgi:predicted peptidase